MGAATTWARDEMGAVTTDTLGLLMAPHRLPACFSFEEERAECGARLAAPPRLHEVAARLRRRFASRAAAHRNVSAAAW